MGAEEKMKNEENFLIREKWKNGKEKQWRQD